MFTPLHQKYVNDCYKNDGMFPEKCSLVVHHIHVKFMRITKILKHMQDKCKSELRKTGRCTNTILLLDAIYADFSSKSAVFEKYIFRIIIIILDHIQKEYSNLILYKRIYAKEELKNDLQERYKLYLDFLDIFYSSEMKTYVSNKYVKMMLESVSNVLSLKSDRSGDDNYKSNDDFQNRDSTSEETESLNNYEYIEQDEKNEEYDYLILQILEKMLLLKDILNSFCCEKTTWILVALSNNKVNVEKRTEILSNVIVEKTNIVNIRDFLGCFLKIEVRKVSDSCNINVLFMNLKKEYLLYFLMIINNQILRKKEVIYKMIKIEEGKNKEKDNSNANEKFLRLYNSGNYVNTNFSNISKVLKTDSEDLIIFTEKLFENDLLYSLYQSEEYKPLFMMIIWSYSIIYNRKDLTLNTYEVVKSYLSLIEGIFTFSFSKEKENHVLSFPSKKLQKKHIDCDCEIKISSIGIPTFIKANIRYFFRSCNMISDVFFYFIKTIFINEILPQTPEKNSYEENKQNEPVINEIRKFILSEIYTYTQEMPIHLDEKFCALLVEVKDKVELFETDILKIFLNLSRHKKIKNTESYGLFCKFRSNYYVKKEKMYLELMSNLLVEDEKLQKNETITTLHVLFKIKNTDKTIDLDVYEFAEKSNIDMKVYEKTKLMNHYDHPYNVLDDEIVYNDMLKTEKKIYSHSIKSSINTGGLVSKRKSRINMSGFFNSSNKD